MWAEPVHVASPHPLAQGTAAVVVLTAATRPGVSPGAGTELSPHESGQNPVELRVSEILFLPFYGSGNRGSEHCVAYPPCPGLGYRVQSPAAPWSGG